jgi:undecaprenyl-diphosphatase
LPLWQISMLRQLTPKSCYPLGESTSFPPNPLMSVSAIVKFPRREVSDQRKLSSVYLGEEVRKLAASLGWFLSWDVKVFYLINIRLQNSLFDFSMPVLTNLHYWRIPLVGIWLALMIWGGKRGRLAAGAGVLALLFSDQLSSHLLKPLFARVRPCHTLSGVRLLVGCSGSYSLPSSHATNCFSIATLFSLEYRKAALPLIVIALLVSYSRVYVGVHYPLDVLTGVFLGVICGRATWEIKKQMIAALAKRRKFN